MQAGNRTARRPGRVQGPGPGRGGGRGHNGATRPALKVEGHSRDEAPSAAAHPGDPLNTVPDGPDRRLAVRDGETQAGRAADPGRARGAADGAVREGRALRPVLAVAAMGRDPSPAL